MLTLYDLDSLLEPKATSSIDQVHLSQPLCTAIQIALVDLLKEWGVTPTACIGHSSGISPSQWKLSYKCLPHFTL
jgi:acyl transferase domain-containing protein